MIVNVRVECFVQFEVFGVIHNDGSGGGGWQQLGKGSDSTGRSLMTGKTG